MLRWSIYGVAAPFDKVYASMHNKLRDCDKPTTRLIQKRATLELAKQLSQTSSYVSLAIVTFFIPNLKQNNQFVDCQSRQYAFHRIAVWLVLVTNSLLWCILIQNALNAKMRKRPIGFAKQSPECSCGGGGALPEPVTTPPCRIVRAPTTEFKEPEAAMAERRIRGNILRGSRSGRNCGN